MSTLPDHIYFKDRSGRFIRINKAHAKRFGLSDPKQAQGKTDFDFFTEEHAQQAYEDEQTIIRTGQPLSKEERETHPNHPDTWVSTVKLPLRDKDGNIIGTFGISRDITKRKLAEEALHESQHLFQTLAQVSPVGIFRTNSDGYTTYVNPKYSELTGLSFEDVIGNGWLNAVHPDDKEKLKESWLSDYKSRKISSAEYRFIRPDGSIVWVIGYAVPELIDNEIVGYVGTVTDITERKLAEKAMKHAKEKAEASDQLKTTFLNNISHEVRTPLNGILGFAEIMSQTDLSEEEKRDSLSMLHESSDRLLNTISNYMDISLITSGSMSVHNKDFIPGQVLRRIFDNYKTICSDRKLELLLEIPEQTENLPVKSDPEIFGKIIFHLLNNAIKFTEKGSINFGYIICEGDFEFFVKDTGIGIGKESISSIFDRFVKEDRGPSSLSEGSGLGLSIAKGMIDIIGGTIRVESEVGAGSCFYFTIPLMKETKISLSGTSGREPSGKNGGVY
jgi:PAS domain S-box-containing protein